jgi:formylglycine-generating enzyme required for sulfatase activity
VTVAQWRAFVKDSGHEPEDPDSLRGVDNHPVVRVTWYEAIAYCRWLTGKLRDWKETPEPLAALLRDEGWEITLPSEAQWEKAARGTDGRVFPWGDDPDPVRANYADTGIETTIAVGCFPGGASPYGVEDLSGNVWEWCRTKWQGSYRDYRDDNRLEGRYARVLRGGAFNSVARRVRCACRSWDDPDDRLSYIGFRLVASPGS